MQTLKFIRRSHGISKKENPYDMTEVSDGLSSFTLSNAEGVGREIEALKLTQGEEFECEVHVSQIYGALRGTIVAVKIPDGFPDEN